MGIIIHVPINLDMVALLRAHPTTSLPTAVKRSIDILSYFCSILVTTRLKHGGYNDRNEGFTSLHSPYLKKIHIKYKAYLDYLIQTDVLEEDGYYVKGSKSKG